MSIARELGFLDLGPAGIRGEAQYLSSLSWERGFQHLAGPLTEVKRGRLDSRPIPSTTAFHTMLCT